MRSIFSKVFFANLLTLLVALAVISIFLPSAFRSVFMRLAVADLQERASIMGRELDPLIASAKKPEDIVKLVQLVRLMQGSSQLQLCVEIPRGQGKAPLVLGQSLVGPYGKEIGPASGQVHPGETKVASGPIVAQCGEDMWITNVPLSQSKATLFVRVSLASAVGETVYQLQKLIAYSLGAAVMIALLLALYLSRRISGPLRRMRILSGRMAGGDFSQRLALKTSDEVGQLAQSFDSLANSLEGTLNALQREQGRLSSILASVAEGIIAVDAESRVALLNPQAAVLLEVDQQETLGSHISEFPLPEHVTQQFYRCLETSTLCSVEFVRERPQRNLVLYVAPVQAGEGEPWGAVAVIQDVTESRQMDEMRRRFISDASHEIRTPLTAIGGFASAIADGTATTDEQRIHCASFIVKEVDRLSRLVNDLLDLSRIESGAVKLTLEEVDLGELIGAAIEAFETQTREQGMKIEVNLPADLPTVRADPDRIYQVLVNLLSNAIRFNRPEGRIAIAARKTNGQVRVEVQDTGTGIPPEELPYIWERFRRADSARTRQEGGTGLGLAIVRSIVEAHGGSVHAESAIGNGSTMSFTLPIT